MNNTNKARLEWVKCTSRDKKKKGGMTSERYIPYSERHCH
ncbi:hypothetical protein AG1IA_09178 [Rhizoctonia solani AG-1 IA]|uniref:Uncharacterized protein n=1 Tax=Thanatephorus cucumeris (strain AG1-IA) TaxID=983506 RepID=L8WJA2_THACA|nr:hypothetical protein AG1IA_09178 [Rhizoctonia solani AG-1 IA]